MTPGSLPLTPDRLRRLAAAGLIDAEGYARGLEALGAPTSSDAMLRTARRALLGLGVVLTAVGVIFFFAANWQGMHRALRLGSLALAVIAAAGIGGRLGPRSAGGSVALTLAALLLGPLLAVYGQTYQTGADAYGLFLGWAALALPFALLGGSLPLWLTILALLNVGIALRSVQLYLPFADEASVIFWSGVGLFALNAAALGLLLWGQRRGVSWLLGRTGPRILAVVLLLLLAPGALAIVVGEGDVLGGAGHQLLWAGMTLGFLAALYRGHATPRGDLFLLALVGGFLWVLGCIFLGKVIFNDMNLEMGGLLLMGLAVLASAALLARWLMGWRRRMEEAPASAAVEVDHGAL